MTVPVQELIDEGRAALRAGDAVGARRALERALASSPSGEVLEGLARATYLELDFPRAIEGWERAYAAYRKVGDQLGAIRVARTLAGMYLAIVGDRAVSGGWLARAQTLLAGAADSAEAGWVALNLGMFEGDRVRKEQRFRQALAAARRFGDTDLELVTLAYLGASLVHGDRIEEGMVLLDEALAAVAGSEVDDFLVLEEVFCQLFSACEHAQDVARAEQWIRVGEAIAQRRKLPAVSAFCRTHYGGVLTAAGRWPEADAALTEAVRLWGLGQRSGLRVGALVRLADLRVRQGRLEQAAQLLDGFDAEVEVEAARPLAAIHLARGETSLARDVLERARTSSSATVPPRRRCWHCWWTCTWRMARLPRRTPRWRRWSAARPGTRVTTSRPWRRWRVGGCVWRRAPAIHARACARRWPASPGRSCRWSWRAPGWRWPTPWSPSGPRWRWPRRGQRWRRSSGCRRPVTPTPPPRCCARSGSRPPQARRVAGR